MAPSEPTNLLAKRHACDVHNDMPITCVKASLAHILFPPPRVISNGNAIERVSAMLSGRFKNLCKSRLQLPGQAPLVPNLTNLSKSRGWQPSVMAAWAMCWTCGPAISPQAHCSNNTVANALLALPTGTSSTMTCPLNRGLLAAMEKSSIGLSWEGKQLPHAHQTEPLTNKQCAKQCQCQGRSALAKHKPH